LDQSASCQRRGPERMVRVCLSDLGLKLKSTLDREVECHRIHASILILRIDESLGVLSGACLANVRATAGSEEHLELQEPVVVIRGDGRDQGDVLAAQDIDRDFPGREILYLLVGGHFGGEFCGDCRRESLYEIG